MQDKKILISVKLPLALLEEIKGLVEDGYFENRTDVLIKSTKLMLKTVSEQKDGYSIVFENKEGQKKPLGIF